MGRGRFSKAPGGVRNLKKALQTPENVFTTPDSWYLFRSPQLHSSLLWARFTRVLSASPSGIATSPFRGHYSLETISRTWKHTFVLRFNQAFNIVSAAALQKHAAVQRCATKEQEKRSPFGPVLYTYMCVALPWNLLLMHGCNGGKSPNIIPDI